jgi:hypothetical protein
MSQTLLPGDLVATKGQVLIEQLGGYCEMWHEGIGLLIAHHYRCNELGEQLSLVLLEGSLWWIAALDLESIE